MQKLELDVILPRPVLGRAGIHLSAKRLQPLGDVGAARRGDIASHAHIHAYSFPQWFPRRDYRLKVTKGGSLDLKKLKQTNVSVQFILRRVAQDSLNSVALSNKVQNSKH